MASIIRIMTLLFLLLSISGYGVAQPNNLDSLELLLHDKGCSVDEKLRIYDDLSWEYLNVSFDKSSRMAREGIKLAHREENLLMEATLMRNLGVAYYMDNRLDSADLILSDALATAKRSSEVAIEAAVYAALGNLYNVQNRYDIAIENYNKALPIYEALGRVDKVYTITANIGALYYNRRNYPQAEKYLLTARKVAAEVGDILIQGQIAQNLSNIYFATSKPAEAYECARQAVDFYREAGDEYNLVLSLTSLSGACHTHLKDNTLAMTYAREALEKARNINMPNLISASLCNIAYAYYRNKDYRQALDAAQECISLTDSTDLQQLIAINTTLAECHIHLGEAAKAEQTLHTVYELMARQSDEQIGYALAEMEVRYDTQKKEDAITTLSREKQLLWVITITLIIAVVLLIVALILYNRYQRQKRLRTEEQMRAFEAQKQLLAAEWLLNGENRERARISRELHDGLGGVLTMAKLQISQSNASESLISLMENAITEMRRISSNLMPEMLGRFGLRPTLSEYCKSSPAVDLHFYGEDLRYDPAVEMNLYRIACELINNALKHSEATQINVQLITEKERVSLIVQDNGKGFDVATASGSGLSNIKNRSSLMGASLDIFSTIGSGTEITVDLKINAAL